MILGNLQIVLRIEGKETAIGRVAEVSSRPCPARVGQSAGVKTGLADTLAMVDIDKLADHVWRGTCAHRALQGIDHGGRRAVHFALYRSHRREAIVGGLDRVRQLDVA